MVLWGPIEFGIQQVLKSGLERSFTQIYSFDSKIISLDGQKKRDILMLKSSASFGDASDKFFSLTASLLFPQRKDCSDFDELNTKK